MLDKEKMRLSKNKSVTSTSLIGDHKTKKSPISSLPNRAHQSSIQCYSSRQGQTLDSIVDRSSPSAEYIYTEIVKAIGNNEFIEEKRMK